MYTLSRRSGIFSSSLASGGYSHLSSIGPTSGASIFLNPLTTSLQSIRTFHQLPTYTANVTSTAAAQQQAIKRYYQIHGAYITRALHSSTIVRTSTTEPSAQTSSDSHPAAPTSSEVPPNASSSATEADKPKRTSRFGLFSSISARRKHYAEKIADAKAEEAAILQEEAEEAQRLAEEEARLAAEDEALKSLLSPESIGAPGLSDSQVHGILAKRAALLAIHPLKMLITSPRQGLDKIRIVPLALQRRIDDILRAEHYQSGQNSVIQDKNYPLWHVANRSAIEFGVMARIFDEIVKRLPSLNPQSVLDYGAATSMSLLALQDSLEKYANKDEKNEIKRPIRTYRIIESNSGLARYGTQLIEPTVGAENIEVKYRSTLPTMPADPSTLEKSDIVVAPFSLGLLTQTERRHRAAEVLWESVAPGGVLILVEGGTIESFDCIRQLREHLLDKYGMRSVAQRVSGDKSIAANAIAPCGSNGVCPMADKSLQRSCWHRAEMLTSSLPLRMPQRHLRSKDGITVETFSYLVLHKGPVRTAVADADAALLKWKAKPKDLVEVGQQGWEAIARQESFDLQDQLRRQEEEIMRQEALDEMAEEDRLAGIEPNTEKDEDTTGAVEAVDSQAAPADPNAASSTPSSTPVLPVTKRSDLTPVAHLLPSDTVPSNTMFDHSYSRILRRPLKRGEHVILDLCTEEAKLERRIIAKSYGIPYTLARSVSESDLWPLRKHVRSPDAPLSPSQLHRLALKERKAKRSATLSKMDEEEATLARQELNAQKAANRAKREQERLERLQEKNDARIIARGGTPPKRSSAKEKDGSISVQPEPEDVIFMDEDELNELDEAELAKFRVPGTKKIITPPKEVTEEAMGDDEAASDTKPDTKAAKPKSKTKKERTTVRTPFGEQDISHTGGISRMPDWMNRIVKHTRPAVGGGLEYVGGQNQRTRKTIEDIEDEEVEGEYVFEADPTIAEAAKLAVRNKNNIPTDEDETPSMAQLEEEANEHLDKEIARKLSEKQRREKSPLLTKRKLENEDDDEWSEQQSQSPMQPKSDKKVGSPQESLKSASSKSKKGESSSQHDSNDKKSAPSPKQPKSAPLEAARPNSATAGHTQSSAHIADNTASSASASPIASVATNSTETSSSSTSSSPLEFSRSSSSYGQDHAVDPTSTESSPSSFSPSSPRLPKWAKYRAIKNPTATPATPENTAAWPNNSKDALRNTLARSDAEWEAIMEKHRREKEEAKNKSTPAQISFFKREEARRAKERANGGAQSSGTSSVAPSKSTLPPHLAALKAAAYTSPANARYIADRDRMRQTRDSFEANSRSRSTKDSNSTKPRSNRDRKPFSARN